MKIQKKVIQLIILDVQMNVKQLKVIIMKLKIKLK